MEKANVDPANGISDITEADFLRNFVGPDGEKLFKEGGREGGTLCLQPLCRLLQSSFEQTSRKECCSGL